MCGKYCIAYLKILNPLELVVQHCFILYMVASWSLVYCNVNFVLYHVYCVWSGLQRSTCWVIFLVGKICKEGNKQLRRELV